MRVLNATGVLRIGASAGTGPDCTKDGRILSSNLPAPIDPNLLPAYREGLRASYSQDVFLVQTELKAQASLDFLAAVPEGHRLELRLRGPFLEAVTEGGTPLGRLEHPGLEILVRLLEAGKHLIGKYGPPGEVAVWLLEM
ncbi:MAG: hypothetical protein KF760_32910 [Candidatus Eremiobacteraeota bacterium]|nr:hypothetical protein [Candidatus Eremiobacteraeota bacterium]MCW5868524.1 hypothetical protein [Candidatus Eremiobacteraeota bacterium]